MVYPHHSENDIKKAEQTTSLHNSFHLISAVIFKLHHYSSVFQYWIFEFFRHYFCPKKFSVSSSNERISNNVFLNIDIIDLSIYIYFK